MARPSLPGDLSRNPPRLPPSVPAQERGLQQHDPAAGVPGGPLVRVHPRVAGLLDRVAHLQHRRRDGPLPGPVGAHTGRVPGVPGGTGGERLEELPEREAARRHPLRHPEGGGAALGSQHRHAV